MLTLALTGTEPETVDPEAGAVIVTTKPPNCAWAGGKIKARPEITNRTPHKRVCRSSTWISPYF